MSPSEASSASEWKKSAFQVVEVPSGNKCKAHRKPLQAFVKAGMIPNSLMPIVTLWLKKAQGGGKDIEADIDLDNMEQVTDMLDLVDNVVIDVLDDPKVYPVPVPAEGEMEAPERDPEKLYIDEVAFDDKQFIYGWALGAVESLESFRKERKGTVGSISAGEDVELPTIGTVSN